MSTGPISQFCTSDNDTTRQSANTSIIRSYFTFARGGYIIRIRPIAIGTLVVPTSKRPMISRTPGASHPTVMPNTMARKIHSVR